MQEQVFDDTTIRGLPALTPAQIRYLCPFCQYQGTLADQPAHRATPEHKRMAAR